MMSSLVFAFLLVGWSCYVSSYAPSHPIKMNHQICNYYDLMEFLAPVCSRYYKRYRRDIKQEDTVKAKYVDDANKARSFLKSSFARRSRRSASRDVSYFEECCTNKICNFQELTEYCYVIPFGRLSY